MFKKVGDKATEYVDSVNRTLTGKVVYVHPRGRYYIVRFDFLYGSFCESFTGYRYSAY